MLFNSLDFAIFLPIVFLLYWLLAKRKLTFQNLLIVVASYVFYGWWDWRFLFLIAFSTVVDFAVGLRLSQTEVPIKRKALLWTSICVNLGLLGFFKYYNFFVDNFITAFSFLGMPFEAQSLNIILPVGISFYTFQTLSYTIDVYNRKLQPTSNFVAFAAFVSFFPQLVAGPIERATNLLPQFYDKRKFEYGKAVDGLRQMLWGFFKKIVIADNCAEFANMAFNNSPEYSGLTLLAGAVFFAFQIYCDFSGYSDIAIGTARLFGFRLRQNFAFPYFSRNIGEFWRRWHISLSSWFKDYLYIPLGGSRGGLAKTIRNVFIIFVVSGFWHGANWTFIVWGALNALYFIPEFLRKKNRKYLEVVDQDRLLPRWSSLGSMGLTFALTVLAWIFFRAENIGHALTYLKDLFKGLTNLQAYMDGARFVRNMGYDLLLVILGFIVVEWLGRTQLYAIERLGTKWPRWVRLGFYYGLILLIIQFAGKEQEFIYFQF